MLERISVLMALPSKLIRPVMMSLLCCVCCDFLLPLPHFQPEPSQVSMEMILGTPKDSRSVVDCAVVNGVLSQSSWSDITSQNNSSCLNALEWSFTLIYMLLGMWPPSCALSCNTIPVGACFCWAPFTQNTVILNRMLTMTTNDDCRSWGSLKFSHHSINPIPSTNKLLT